MWVSRCKRNAGFPPKYGRFLLLPLVYKTKRWQDCVTVTLSVQIISCVMLWRLMLVTVSYRSFMPVKGDGISDTDWALVRTQ